jgi:hypothetical protein
MTLKLYRTLKPSHGIVYPSRSSTFVCVKRRKYLQQPYASITPPTHSSFPFATIFIEEKDGRVSFATYVLFLRSLSKTWIVAFRLRKRKKMACGVHRLRFMELVES